MLEEFLNQRMILAILIILVLAWVGVILFRVGREKAILQVDFWKSKWKIVLFWFVVAAVAFAAWYFWQKYKS